MLECDKDDRTNIFYSKQSDPCRKNVKSNNSDCLECLNSVREEHAAAACLEVFSFLYACVYVI